MCIFGDHFVIWGEERFMNFGFKTLEVTILRFYFWFPVLVK